DPARGPARGARLPGEAVSRACLAGGDRSLPGGGVGLARDALGLHRPADLDPGRAGLYPGTVRHRAAVMDICFSSARKLASLLLKRKISAVEVVGAFIAQVERVNPKVNAIVTFLPEQALKAAKALDRKKQKSLFAGLPIAYKDNVPTKGIRTTFGSPIFENNIPREDHL